MYKCRYKESDKYDKALIRKYWCTEYCQQRGSEAVGHKIKIAYDRDAGGYHNAKAWLKYSNYPTSTYPKAGCIAVWDNDNYGHVAFVEDCFPKVGDYYHISVTQANEFSTFFTGEYDVKVGEINQGIGKLLGFIILPVDDLRIKELLIEVLADGLRVRDTPGGSYISGLECPKGIYRCELVSHDGITWAKLDDHAYIMTNENDCWTHIL